MERQVTKLWRMVRPGGRLAITTWGPRFLEPASTLWWKSVAKECPDLVRSFGPWDRISDPGQLRRLLEDSGVTGTEIVAEDGWQVLQRPEDWWTMILGTGYRWTIEQMDDAMAVRIRDANIHSIRDRSVAAVETNVVYAVATKGAS